MEEDYWAKEAKALGLLVHFDVPEEERAPKGNVPADLVYQQRYHPHTGVNWGAFYTFPLLLLEEGEKFYRSGVIQNMIAQPLTCPSHSNSYALPIQSVYPSNQFTYDSVQ